MIRCTFDPFLSTDTFGVQIRSQIDSEDGVFYMLLYNPLLFDGLKCLEFFFAFCVKEKKLFIVVSI